MIGWTNDEALELARQRYGSDDIQIDTDARIIHLEEAGPDEGGAWVQAWVYVAPKENEDEIRSQQ